MHIDKIRKAASHLFRNKGLLDYFLVIIDPF
jgi:hypothetical protein